MITALDHVQLAAPPGTEPALRAYYGEALGMTEIPKPASLAANGGLWFRSGPVQLHLGIEKGFRPSAKAHPGIRVTAIDAFATRLAEHGARVIWDEQLPGHRRFYSEDPAGNRLEFLTSPDPHKAVHTDEHRVPYGTEAIIPDGPAKGFVIGEVMVRR
ncbi:VOC family protein [Streptomyces sp. NPDC005271]|uniref:VOC family protein n=1 Tax=unclassified Streptomyces TaxID=2593676 RepID=UPI0033B5BFE5